MATILNKDLVRESTISVNDKPLIITLKDDQSIELKLKGIRSGDILNINLLELWAYLGGEDNEAPKKGGVVAITKAKPKKGDNKMISLYDLRSANAISTMSIGDIAKFDIIISDMIKNLNL